jgi:translation initiation factor 3 subunit A
MEVVVKEFLKQAEERAKEAQSKADSVVLDVEDLEAEESAEGAMISSISGEDSKDRTDREIVTPWLKFLWETYRTILEIVRNNNKLEAVYQVRS